MIGKMNKMLRNRKGFTLIELIVVIAILGILAAIAVPKFSGFQANANVKAAKMTMKTIDTAIQAVASEKSVSTATVATTDSYLQDVAALLGWTISTIANGRVVTVDPVTPTGATYSITAAGQPQVVIAAGTPWKSTVGTESSGVYTVTWTQIKGQ